MSDSMQTDYKWEAEPNLDELRRLHGMLSTDPAQALAGLKELADRGSVMSMVYVANAYRKGIGTAADRHQSEQWFRRASEAGSALASYELGRGFLDDHDYAKAQEMFQVGVARGYAPSMHVLAIMYVKGRGVPIDLQRARELLEPAAAGGHIFAKQNLGRLLVRGKFGAGLIPRGILLILSSLKDVLIYAGRIPLDDRFR